MEVIRMSKAVLVMEMPSCCVECPASDITGEWCSVFANKKVSNEHLYGAKPDWCPLKPMPAKKEENYRSEFARGIKKGWNDAIKAIENNPHK